MLMADFSSCLAEFDSCIFSYRGIRVQEIGKKRVVSNKKCTYQLLRMRNNIGQNSNKIISKHFLEELIIQHF